MAVTWGAVLRISLLLILLATIITALITLPIEKILKDFLIWIDQNLGPWGPLVLAVAYIPLTVLAVPASVLTLGGGYLFGLPLGFVADSIGATIGATAAFLLGRTIGRSYVISKLKDYPQFQAVAIAIQRSGFKPITFALVYVGTTLKDLSDVTHGWGEISTTRWVVIVLGLLVSVILMVCVTKVAKSSLDKALAENGDMAALDSPQLPLTADPSSELHRPLIIKIDSLGDDHEK
ncbi:hypothetical protein AQUCO_13500016v1 [Aquilegia coerulea]|uniref:VTT domain-containing protein n=1 Tax=Aquilegia coerulea TaxID=218851 RepID=A0A2G5C133_AQUCA|nr:hypothetical protein AQUCO_13500016v1 [Aquilegia coerulea]